MSKVVWRIGYSGDLTLSGLGVGSTKGEGRWHLNCTGGLQVVYCGSSRALCQLEKRVHLNGVMPRIADMALLCLHIPDAASLIDVASLGLPDDWKTNVALTQSIGMSWLAGKGSLGLWVPSFVEPAERNLLLNPVHLDYQRIELVIEKNPFIFDPRLFS